MAEPRRVRADAERNRHAILAATEKLLRGSDPGQVTIERVAEVAGVGKATVFHRFGNRMGLMQAVMEQRATALQEAIVAGPPPLGPGAPARERFIAFLDAVTDLVTQNAGLMTAHDHAAAVRKNTSGERQENSVYQTWHAHVAGLIEEARPELDGALLAHLILGGLHTEPVARLIRDGEFQRLRTSLRDLATALLGTTGE